MSSKPFFTAGSRGAWFWEALLLAAPWAWGCKRVGPAPATPNPAAEVQPSSAIPTASSACAVLERRHRSTLRGMQRASCAVPYLAADSPFDCTATGNTTWAMMANAKRSRANEARGQDEPLGCDDAPLLALDLMFRSADGREAASPTFAWFDGMAAGSSHPSIVTVYDYDGDGSAEVVVDDSGASEGASFDHYSVWTTRGATIVAYAPAARLTITGVEDVDKDGRPDLLVAVHEANTSDAGVAGETTRFVGLAHAKRGGTFSLDDEQTRSFYRRVCPQKPTRIVERTPQGRNDVTTGANIVCARAWSMSELAIRAELDKSCKAWSDDVGGAPDPEKMPIESACPEWWRRWLTAARDARL